MVRAFEATVGSRRRGTAGTIQSMPQTHGMVGWQIEEVLLHGNLDRQDEFLLRLVRLTQSNIMSLSGV